MSRFLRNVLLADAAVSGAAAAAMLLGGSWLQSLLNLPGELLLPAGLVLAAYAGLVAWLARRESLPRVTVWALIACNVAWAADCVAIAIAPWFAPNALGQAFLGLQVVAVLAFAELQFMALRRPQPLAMA
jgi:hypothetical protein